MCSDYVGDMRQRARLVTGGISSSGSAGFWARLPTCGWALLPSQTLGVVSIGPKNTISAMRGALLAGAVTGAGIALLECRAAVSAYGRASEDEYAGIASRIIGRAIEEPACVLLTNAGLDAAAVIASAESGSGDDPCDTEDAESVIDSVETVKAALETAISSAALALTVDVLVHHRAPQTAANP
jgi:chaperonin GroEL (HSP60 family)